MANGPEAALAAVIVVVAVCNETMLSTWYDSSKGDAGAPTGYSGLASPAALCGPVPISSCAVMVNAVSSLVTKLCASAEGVSFTGFTVMVNVA